MPDDLSTILEALDRDLARLAGSPRTSSTCSTSRSRPTPATSRRKRKASSLYYHSVSKYISRDGGGTGAARDRGVEEMRSLFVARVSP